MMKLIIALRDCFDKVSRANKYINKLWQSFHEEAFLGLLTFISFSDSVTSNSAYDIWTRVSVSCCNYYHYLSDRHEETNWIIQSLDDWLQKLTTKLHRNIAKAGHRKLMHHLQNSHKCLQHDWRLQGPVIAKPLSIHVHVHAELWVTAYLNRMNAH
jgi:hypothetical protein